MSKVNTVYPSERIEYDDRVTGRRVIQLTSKANNAKGYFTAPHFVDGGETLVFCSDRTGTWEVFKMEMKTGKIVQLTDDANLTGLNSRISLCTNPTRPLAYVMAGKNDRLLEIDVEHGGSRVMHRIPDGFFGDLIVTNADGSEIASSYIQDFFNVPNQLLTRIPGKLYSGGIEYRYRRPISVVFWVDTRSGVAEAAWGDNEYLDHVQIPQHDPQRIIFCHGAADVPQRMYIIEKKSIAGKKPKPLFQQDAPNDGLGHEFACPDGWIGFQYRRFHGGYRQNPLDYFGFIDPATAATELFRMPGPRCGHFQATADRKRAIADGDSPADQPEQWDAAYIRTMARYDLSNGRATPTPLCMHDSSFKTHESHPHPVLTPDEQYALWASDRGGSTHLYMCRFND